MTSTRRAYGAGFQGWVNRRCRGPAGLHVFLAGLALLVSGPPSAAEEPPLPPAESDLLPEENNPLESGKVAAALAGLEERGRMIQDMILDAARAYRQAALDRSAAVLEWITSQERLDREAVRAREVSLERLEPLLKEVQQTRSRAAAAQEESDRRLNDMRSLLNEREALNRRLASLRTRLPQQEGILTGVWEVSWLPGGLSGTFFLDQSGTLVTGQYRLGPAGSGSLQGTFVNGKVFLQRIDAQRGRDAELEGMLEAGGNQIRGTWQNYELVQGGLPRGQWVARRTR